MPQLRLDIQLILVSGNLLRLGKGNKNKFNFELSARNSSGSNGTSRPEPRLPFVALISAQRDSKPSNILTEKVSHEDIAESETKTHLNAHAQ